MDEFDFYNKHYIQTREDGCVIKGWSDGPHNGRTVTENDILLNDNGGYQFRLIVDGALTEENPPLFDFDYMIPLYKWDGEKVLRRSEEEIEAERAAIPEPPPTELERLRADVDFVMAMEGLL